MNQAKWVRVEDKTMYWYECSNCKEKPPKNQYGNEWFSPYCPNCGSIMIKDEEIEEGDISPYLNSKIAEFLDDMDDEE